MEIWITLEKCTYILVFDLKLWSDRLSGKKWRDVEFIIIIIRINGDLFKFNSNDFINGMFKNLW